MYVNFPGARMVILREFYTEYRRILNIAVKYVVATATWLSMFMHFAYKYNLFCSKTLNFFRTLLLASDKIPYILKFINIKFNNYTCNFSPQQLQFLYSSSHLTIDLIL